MRPLPTSLQVVAILFILSGVSAIVEVLTALLSHRISINLGVLVLFIGVGLFRRNPRSLSWALVVACLELALTALVAVLFLFIPGTIQFFGRPGAPAPPGAGFVLSLGMLALFYWQYRVLTSSATRAVFEEQDAGTSGE